MSRLTKGRVHREVEAHLKDLGLPWSIERGAKHWKILLEGRLMGVICNGQGRDAKQIKANIRKYLESKRCTADS